MNDYIFLIGYCLFSILGFWQYKNRPEEKKNNHFNLVFGIVMAVLAVVKTIRMGLWG